MASSLNERQQNLWGFLVQHAPGKLPKKADIARHMGIKNQSVDGQLRALAKHGLLTFGRDGWQFSTTAATKEGLHQRAAELSINLPDSVLNVFPNREQEGYLLEKIEALCFIIGVALTEGYAVEDDRPFKPEDFAARVNAYRAELCGHLAAWFEATKEYGINGY